MTLRNLLSLFNRLRQIFIIQLYSEYTIATYFRREEGVKIGKNCRIIGRRRRMFGSEPYLIEIGDNVTLTEDVKFVTHDGGVGIFRSEEPGLNVYGKIVIKDNCFIGMNAILLPNVRIGPNSVVGAGAVVTRDVPPNSVVAGIPARVIMSIDEYKMKAMQKGLIVHEQDYEKKREVVLRHVNAPQRPS